MIKLVRSFISILLLVLIAVGVKFRNKDIFHRKIVRILYCIAVCALIVINITDISTLYYKIRLLLFVLFVFIGVLIMIIRTRMSRKRVFIIVIFAFVCTLLLSIFPVENLCLRFSTPDKAFAYRHNYSSLIKIVQDEDMAVAIYYNSENDDSTSMTILEKDDKGWMVNTSDANNLQSDFIHNYVIVTAESTRNSKTMVMISNPLMASDDKTPLQISDSRNSRFQHFSYQANKIEVNNYFYTMVPNMDNKYSINVNGHIEKLQEFISSQRRTNLIIEIVTVVLNLLFVTFIFFVAYKYYIKGRA